MCLEPSRFFLLRAESTNTAIACRIYQDLSKTKKQKLVVQLLLPTCESEWVSYWAVELEFWSNVYISLRSSSCNSWPSTTMDP